MKLDRNLNADRCGKYAVIKLRAMRDCQSGPFRELPPDLETAFDRLEKSELIDWGNVGTESEFMLIRLKDKYAQAALEAYADAARADDPEYAAEIDDMASRSGPNSPWCKRPD